MSGAAGPLGARPAGPWGRGPLVRNATRRRAGGAAARPDIQPSSRARVGDAGEAARAPRARPRAARPYASRRHTLRTAPSGDISQRGSANAPVGSGSCPACRRPPGGGMRQPGRPSHYLRRGARPMRTDRWLLGNGPLVLGARTAGPQIFWAAWLGGREERLLDGLAQRMPHQHVAFLDARRFPRGHGEQNLRHGGHFAAALTGEGDGAAAALARGG
jgi:hypothetical protein